MILAALQRFYNRYAQVASLSRVVPTWQAGRALPDPHDFRLLAEEGYRQSAIIYACIREKATSSVEPECVVETQARGGDWQPVSPTHPLAQRLAQPNPSSDLAAILEASLTHIDLSGNSFMHKLRSASGAVAGLYTLRPDRIKIVPAADGTISHYDFVVGDVVKDRIPFDDVIHIKYNDPLDDYYGLSPLVPAARAGDVDNQSIEYLRAFFFNRGIPSGLLKFKSQTTPDQRDRIREMWSERYVGPQGWHQVSVLDENVEYEELSQGLSSLNMQSVFDVSESRICAVLGVPPIVIGAKVGLEHATYANYKEARRSLWQETLLPLYKKYERALTHHLASEYGTGLRIRFDTSKVSALQEDFESRRAFALKSWNSSLMTRNEAFAVAGEPLLADVLLGSQYKHDATAEKLSVGTNSQLSVVSGDKIPTVNCQLSTSPLPPAFYWQLTTGNYQPSPLPPVRYADPDSWQEIHRVADRQVRALQNAWQVSLQDLRSKIDADALQAALEVKNVVVAMQTVPVARVFSEGLVPVWTETITTLVADGAEIAYGTLKAEIPIDIAFNLAHPEAERWIKQHVANLVTEVGDKTRAGIRETILRSFQEAIPPRETARMLTEFVGLRDDQLKAVMNARADWFIEGITGDELEKRVAKLVEKKLLERALAIARTETINAANQGQIELWNQAIEAEYLEPDKSFKEWIVTPDDKLCEICAPLDGQRVLVKDMFETAKGPKSAPTAHVMCRCALGMFLDRT